MTGSRTSEERRLRRWVGRGLSERERRICILEGRVEGRHLEGALLETGRRRSGNWGDEGGRHESRREVVCRRVGEGAVDAVGESGDGAFTRRSVAATLAFLVLPCSHLWVHPSPRRAARRQPPERTRRRDWPAQGAARPKTNGETKLDEDKNEGEDEEEASPSISAPAQERTMTKREKYCSRSRRSRRA